MDDTKTQEDEDNQTGGLVGGTNTTVDLSAAQQSQPQSSAGDRRIGYLVTEAEFDALFIRAAATKNFKEQDDFFGRFAYVQYLLGGNPYLAMRSGRQLLEKCRSVNAPFYDSIHKGTPYYWLGTAAFLVGDYEKAAFFFDAAVSEDVRAGLDPARDASPSFRFLLVEGEKTDQAAKRLVEILQQCIETALTQYNQRPGLSQSPGTIDIKQLRADFLCPALSKGRETWRSLATTLISYFLEWDDRATLLDLRVGGGTAEPFYLHLFKGCVLFESLLKANPKNPATQQTLGQGLKYLAADLGLPSAPSIGNTDFPTVLSDVRGADDQVITAIEFAGRVRNTVGHNLGWDATFGRSEYDKLAGMVASACLHAINCLYRSRSVEHAPAAVSTPA